MKYTKDTTIGELMANNPEKASVLMEAGMQCIGCFVAETEPLEMACAEFGVDINELSPLYILLGLWKGDWREEPP